MTAGAPGGAGGAVAAGHRATAEAMAGVLARGGNAFDAAVAGGLMAAVVEPCLTSLAGGGFLTYRRRDGEAGVVDFFVAAPGLGGRPHDPSRLVRTPVDFGGVVQDFHVGPASVAVPGVLAGYLHVLGRWGRLDPVEVAAPAVDTARRGVTVDAPLARLLAILTPILGARDEGRELFFRDGGPLAEGDRFSNHALGQFLEDLSRGARHGFRPADLGGEVTGVDIERYRVVEREPLVSTHGAATLLGNPAPSLGGRLVVAGLEVLADLPRFHPEDPRCVAELAGALVHMHEVRPLLGAGSSRGTTHLGVVDADGTAVAMTTSNGSGSGVFAPGLGVQLNNMMGEEDLQPAGLGSVPPGRRIASMMAPGLLVGPERVTAVGSGGSERIRSVLLQLVLRLADDREPLAAAVDAPRLHWDGSVLQAEPGFSAEVLERLGRRWPLRRWSGRDLYFGGAHLVSSIGEAAGDPRRGGVGLVL